MLKALTSVDFTYKASPYLRPPPVMDAEDVSRIEANWKDRLHTRKPHGLNEN